MQAKFTSDSDIIKYLQQSHYVKLCELVGDCEEDVDAQTVIDMLSAQVLEIIRTDALQFKMFTLDVHKLLHDVNGYDTYSNLIKIRPSVLQKLHKYNKYLASFCGIRRLQLKEDRHLADCYNIVIVSFDDFKQMLI